jgi:hypothetical protein
MMRVAGVSVAALHLACGLLGWLALELPGSMLLFGLCAVVTLVVALVTAPLLDPPPRNDGGTPDHSGGDAPEPPWWPEFERALREHCTRERSSA